MYSQGYEVCCQAAITITHLQNFFLFPDWVSAPIEQQFLILPRPQPWTVTILFFVRMNLAPLGSSYTHKWNHTVCPFMFGLFYVASCAPVRPRCSRCLNFHLSYCYIPYTHHFHLPFVCRNLGCFGLWAIANNTAMNRSTRVSVSVLLGIIDPEKELLDRMVAVLFSTVAALFYILTTDA